MIRRGCRFSWLGVLCGLALAGAACLQPGQFAVGRDGSHRDRATLAPVGYYWPLPPEPVLGPEPFDPPPVYARWFDRVLRCLELDGGGVGAGHRTEFADLHWFLVDSLPSVGVERRGVGRFVPPDTILIPWRQQGVEWVVEHELVHYVTGEAGHPAGPDDPFRKCGVTDEGLWLEVLRAREVRAGREVPGLLRGVGGNGSPASPVGP